MPLPPSVLTLPFRNLFWNPAMLNEPWFLTDPLIVPSVQVTEAPDAVLFALRDFVST